MANTANEDLRSIKTEKALHGAIFAVLKKQSFKKITVKGICEEAMISRAAFYAHFIDKYDLLRHWMSELWRQNLNGESCYEQIERAVNGNISDITRILKNLVFDVDGELFGVMYDFILSTKKTAADKSNSGEYHKNVALSNFYAGGIISYFLWQLKNNFPAEVPLMNRAIYQMITEFKDR